MEKEILLNDKDIKVKCIIEDGNVYFEFDKNLEFLNNLLRIERNNDLIFVYLGLKKILRIEGKNVEKILSVSMSEIRILRALYENNKDINSLNVIDYFETVKNNVSKSSFSLKFLKRTKTKTESHASLTEILESVELIRFLNEYDIKYPMNEYGLLDFNNGKYYTYEEVKYNGWLTNLENSIRVNLARNVTPQELENANKNREKLLKLACVSLEDMLGDTVEWKKIETDIKKASDDIIDQIRDIDDNMQGKSRSEKKRLNKGKNKLNEKLNKLNNLKSAQAAKILYNELLNISLDKLTNDKISYSTISFSNDSRIEFMSKKHTNDKRFSFIYSIDKNKSVKKFDDFSRSLESLFQSNSVIGCDITGFEEYDSSEYDSLKEKLESILPVLRIHNDSVLRIHACDFVDSSNSIHEVLKAIRETMNKINESCVDLFGKEWGTFNPPSIRIANCLKLDEKDDLVSLIKSFDATIEYNLSSNRALKKVSDYSKVSLAYYDKNNIKYVFSTDGNGMYYTDTTSNLVGTDDIKEAINEVKNIKVEPIEEEKEEVSDNITSIEGENQTYKEDELEQTLFDIFSDLKKDSDGAPILEPLQEDKIEEEVKEEDLKEEVKENIPVEEKEEELPTYESISLDSFDFSNDSYEGALEEENLLFTENGKVLSEQEKVEKELSRIKEYLKENKNDLDMNYITSKINMVKSYNENSSFSDYAKMYLFLLEREMFPDLETYLKSIEYLYNNKSKEKNNIERELDRIFNLVTEQYDNGLL